MLRIALLFASFLPLSRAFTRTCIFRTVTHIAHLRGTGITHVFTLLARLRTCLIRRLSRIIRIALRTLSAHLLPPRFRRDAPAFAAPRITAAAQSARRSQQEHQSRAASRSRGEWRTAIAGWLVVTYDRTCRCALPA